MYPTSILRTGKKPSRGSSKPTFHHPLPTSKSTPSSSHHIKILAKQEIQQEAQTMAFLLQQTPQERIRHKLGTTTQEEDATAAAARFKELAKREREEEAELWKVLLFKRGLMGLSMLGSEEEEEEVQV
ncbi:uncharacterized protein RCC_05942 [Ramularia collo-cygni]|uniref:Uncharacterized protein n=1 Tax=Ramularia collo-cygni TaxID=112498 RepID=A0A2D3V044_9PEZI|nr:uncharacterized protein RCC_05942 [Ramularia collo-cygni]CZT20085.1 uncharacterized protein RCC_05942 [Ramularia collo-cygni]